MKTLLFLIAMLLLNSNLLFSQVSFSADGSTPDPSAMLEVKSTVKGFLLPRMTVVERDSIPDPAAGLLIFCMDCGLEGSLSIFSNGTWKSFSLCFCSAPGAGQSSFSLGQIIWNWDAVADAVGYKWNTTNNYSSAIDLGTQCSKTESGIVCDNIYIRYVWSYNACANSAVTTLTDTILGSAPVTPTSGSHVPSMDSIVWNWNTVAGAIGYKWNTINNYGCATDMGTITTHTETGLTCGTPYTRYVWAYNDCGQSSPVILTKSTLTCWVCGINTITVEHEAGDVAPVDKTVTYGTVTGIAGEPLKCWITRNLGANQQATAKTDATEPSAGWYWQFNRMQGFKHEGQIRTPSDTWITSINEPATDWQACNDPCALELGGTWRIPTNTEWINVDNSGSWVSYNGPWTSPLKMHAAGRLKNTDGTLGYRGSEGYYWSSTYSTDDIGRDLYFSSGACSVGTNNKAFGFTLRCIK